MDKPIKKRGHRHPNSLAQLRPVKKGEVRNPLGGASHDPHKKALRRLTDESVKEIIELALVNNIEALGKVISNKDSSALQVGVARSLVEAIKSGNWIILERIFERLIGRVPDRVQVQAQVQNIPSIKIEFVEP